MKLAVLDLDGTLTRTNDIDSLAYIAAFSQEFGIEEVNPKWEDYPHATDNAIALEIFRQKFGRPPDQAEMQRLQNRFVDLLESARKEEVGHYTLIPGVHEFLHLLHPSNGWAAVIATGSWSRSAALKIAACDLDISAPLYSSDDSISRSEIVEEAIRGALHTWEQTSFERIVLVGDGLWDLTTARQMGYPFVGIASGEKARMLLEHGASEVFEDYRDLPRVMSALLTAEVPGLAVH